MPLALSEEQIAAKLTPATALAAVERAHSALALGKAENSVRQRVRAPGFSLHSLTAASKELELAAAKVYSATRSGMNSTLLLYSTKDGSLIGNFEANELGRRRTAAAAILGFKQLLPNPSPEIAILGTGFQAWGIVEALRASVTSPISLRVFGRDAARRDAFCAQARTLANVQVRSCASALDAAADADSLFIATTSSAPVIEDTALNSVRFICALGANALSRRELDPKSVTRACQVVVDSRDVARLEGGTLLSPIENGRLSWQEIAELGEIITNLRPKQTPKPGNYALLCTHGLAVQDLYTAATLLD